MIVALVVVLAAVSLAFAGLAMREFYLASTFNRSLAQADALDAAETALSRLSTRLDRRVRATRPGAAVERAILRSGVRTSVVAILSMSVAGFLAGSAVFSVLLPGPLALVTGGAAAYGPFGYLRWHRARRVEDFVTQLPDLARVLSNATSAGLSLRSAIGLAAEELVDPAGEELRRTAEALGVGRGLTEALEDLEQRVPSRELAVLVSTLVISSRSGGSLVTALANIAATLDARKELRREVRTQLAQAVASGYLVIGIGVTIVLGVGLFSPDTLDAMLAAGVGRVALIAAAGFFGFGFFLIRRITRIDT